MYYPGTEDPDYRILQNSTKYVYWVALNSSFSGFFFGLLGPFGPKSASSYHKTMVSEKKLGRNLFCAHWRAAVATGRGRTFSVLRYRILYRGYGCMILGNFFLEIFVCTASHYYVSTAKLCVR